MAAITGIKYIQNILNKPNLVKIYIKSRPYASLGKVTIGNVEKEITKAKHPEYVPINYCK